MYALAHEALPQAALERSEPQAGLDRVGLFGGRRGKTGAALSWIVGAGLIMTGGFGLSMDLTMIGFDSASVLAGFLALPPVTDFIRPRLKFSVPGWMHFLGACAVMFGALAYDFTDGAHGGARYPVDSHPQENWFQAVNVIPNAAASERQELAKESYLQDVSSQIKAMDRERALMQETSAEPSDYDDMMLQQRANLLRQRANYSFTPQEAAIVDGLAGRISNARNAMTPSLRRSYIEAINGPLAEYGMMARLVGEDGIEFAGAALADQQKRQTILTLTQAQRTRLGLVNVQFNAGQGPIAASSAPSGSVGPVAQAASPLG